MMIRGVDRLGPLSAVAVVVTCVECLVRTARCRVGQTAYEAFPEQLPESWLVGVWEWRLMMM
jgi:hypothetical protein